MSLSVKKTLRCRADGSDTHSLCRVWVAEDAVPTPVGGQEPDETASVGIELTFPGYMDDEISLVLQEFSDRNSGDGYNDIAGVSMTRDEVKALIRDLQYMVGVMDE